MDMDHFIVKPGKRVRLDRFSTHHTRGVKDQAAAARRLQKNLEELADLQERLYVEDRHAVLLVLQARDGAGKDSTIKHVMSGVNPQGVQITSFKAPSSLELDHDYLWRSVIALPQRGNIGIHNRSYYEEVLVARVHQAVLQRQRLPASARKGNLWKRRYAEINGFERFLVENGTVIVKMFLHISRQEQRQRFQRRLERPDKHWKFSLQDVKERPFWDDYDRAYEHMLEQTSTDIAPWFVLPADHKWYLHLAVSEILVRTLRDLNLKWPKLDASRLAELKEGRRLLELEEQAEGKTKAGRKQ
jgi:PPK2 family polyphosphate:nucleotide phosphotransferase